MDEENQTVANLIPPPVNNIKPNKTQFILFIILVLASFATIGILYYQNTQLKKQLLLNNQAIVPKAETSPPSNSPTQSAIQETNTNTTSETTAFQQILKTKCINSQIDLQDLPISVNFESIEKDYTLKSGEKPTVTCYLSNNRGYVQIGGYYFIFDNESPDPDCLLCRNFFCENCPKSINTNHLSFNIQAQLSGSDFWPVPDSSFEVDGIVTKKIAINENNFIYVRLIDTLIPTKDKRLLKIFSKYHKYDESLKTYVIENDSYTQINDEINHTLFSNFEQLNEPEKTNLNKIESLLNNFSSK